MQINTLYYGDCLTIMREKMEAGSVDLVYLDPPFNSKKDYNAIYKDETGRPLPNQVEAFTDTWELSNERLRTIRNMLVLLRECEVDEHDANFLASFISSLVNSQFDMAAYLAYMTERLLEIKRVMKDTATVYLHCDPTASHYLKIAMDVAFGKDNFLNEVIWHYKRWTATAKRFQRMHDCILWYSKTTTHKFTQPLQPYSDEKWIEDTVRGVVYGKLVRLKDSEGKYIKRKEQRGGVLMHDVWHDINFIAPTSRERLGYPTQKPVKLLERIISASSDPGDVVFDPFCGCATSIEAAEKLNRKWIGIDITIHAVRRVARLRLQDRLHLKEGEDYVIDGVPQNWEGAHHLWEQDPYQFQKWCVEQVEGFVNVKRTADEGIDGRIYFDMSGVNVLQSMALEVKGGENVGINAIRSLNSVLQFENIQMAGLIMLHDLGTRQTKNFRETMALAGDVEIDGKSYPKLQMLTVREILEGKRFDMPQPVGRTKSGYDSDLINHPISN